jgi:hypothetical protein
MPKNRTDTTAYSEPQRIPGADVVNYIKILIEENAELERECAFLRGQIEAKEQATRKFNESDPQT